MPSKGQFLETGYGTASNEKAFDLAISTNGLVMAGYVDSSETGRFLSVWQTDSLGHLLWHYKQTNTATTYARAVTVSPTDQSITAVGAIAPNFAWNETLRDEDQLFVANVSADGNNNWTYTHTTHDTSTAAVDVLPTPTGYAVLANFLPDYSTYSQPYIVFLTDSGTLQGILPLGRNDKTLLAFKMQLNPTDSSLVVAANEYLTSGKVIPTLYTINKTGTTYKSFSYTADDYCEIHSLAQDPAGNWWLAGESYSSGDTLATVIKTNYAYAKQATYTYNYSGYNSFNDIIVDSTQLICIGTTDIYLNPDSIDGQGEGGYDVLVHYISFSGDSILLQTMGGESLDEGHSIIKVPNEDIAFGVGYNNSFGVEESGNAYQFGLVLKSSFLGCEDLVPRILYVDDLIDYRDGNNNIILEVLGNATAENQLIQWAVDNGFTAFAIYKLGYLFDGQSTANQVSSAKTALRLFVVKCYLNGITCGYVADQSMIALQNFGQFNLLNAAISGYNFKQFASKLRFVILEHEFWNATQVNEMTNSSPFNPSVNTYDGWFNTIYSDHITLLWQLMGLNRRDANITYHFDYVNHFFHDNSSDNVNGELGTSQEILRKNRAKQISRITSGIFLTYYKKPELTDLSDALWFLRNPI